jgi:hypothetical protein
MAYGEGADGVKICYVCKKEIKGESVTVGNRYHHNDCLQEKMLEFYAEGIHWGVTNKGGIEKALNKEV